ncbi:MAG: aspartate aminotransferase family protein [Actinobacteria bacterium]|nr:aspartate aminotransferase family protein [Actinomycetota bacterium]MCL6087762.1 aspartate aminotransferase family protein [Actinomycetota bacterium]
MSEKEKIPNIVINPPGPKSEEWHNRASAHMKGYSSQVKQFPVVFESGRGNILYDVDGNSYIDFSAGIYCTSTGHCHPKIVEKTREYVGKLMNCHDFTTPIKAMFMEKLAEHLPGDLSGIQLFNGGSEAVEAAIRAVRTVKDGKYEVFSFWGDWHGKTTQSMSLSSLGNYYFGPRFTGSHLSATPNCYRCPLKQQYPECKLICMDVLEGTIDKEGTGMQAAVCMEPIQGYSGSVVYKDEIMPRVKQICEKRGMFLVDDEVLAGFGRTGKMFCCEYYDVVPDIIVFGKGVAGGFPISGFAIKKEYDWALEKMSASTTYGGNPMACAAGYATLQVFEEENILENVNKVGKFIMDKLSKMKQSHKIIGDVRGKGLLLAIDLVKDISTKEPFTEAGKFVYENAFSKGVAWIPAGNILRLAPALIMTEELADKALDIIDESITEAEKKFGYF